MGSGYRGRPLRGRLRAKDTGVVAVSLPHLLTPSGLLQLPLMA